VGFGVGVVPPLPRQGGSLDTLIAVNPGLVGLFAFAAIHYAVNWWFSRDERVLPMIFGS
jgi:hypothetical protein